MNVSKIFTKNYSPTPAKRLSSDRIQEIIDQIRGLDLSRCEVPYLKHLVDQITWGYGLRESFVHKGALLYRGIRYSSKPKTIDKLTYPPIDSAGLNRASKEGEQMFYAATDAYVPYFELDAKVGDKFAISRWRVVKMLTMNSVGYTIDVFDNLKSVRRPVSRLGNTPEELHPDNVLVHNFLAEQFCQPVAGKFEIYKLTVAIADSLKYGPFDGLLYPTMAMEANADNVALFPSSVDSHLVLEAVGFEEIIAVSPNGNTFTVRGLDYSESFKKEQIRWSGRARKVYDGVQNTKVENFYKYLPK